MAACVHSQIDRLDATVALVVVAVEEPDAGGGGGASGRHKLACVVHGGEVALGGRWLCWWRWRGWCVVVQTQCFGELVVEEAGELAAQIGGDGQL